MARSNSARPVIIVNENGGYATITVTRTGSDLGTAGVHFATTDGTAFAGTNYVATNGTLDVLPGPAWPPASTCRILE